MAKKVLYVAIDGKTKEVFKFTTWDECKEKVQGKDFAFKGFTEKELSEVEDFIKYNTIGVNEDELDTQELDVPYCYVDGGRNTENKICNAYSYGCCIVLNEIVIQEFKQVYSDEYNDMFQIMGELRGALKAVEYCILNDYKKMYLIYDYKGIEKFALGLWNSEKEGIIEYRNLMKQYMDKIDIQFVKVKSHVTEKSIVNIYNDRADTLAKMAIEELKKYYK